MKELNFANMTNFEIITLHSQLEMSISDAMLRMRNDGLIEELSEEKKLVEEEMQRRKIDV